MYRAVMGVAAAALLAALVAMLQVVSIYGDGAYGDVVRLPGQGGWLLGAGMALMFGAIALALVLAVWLEQWLWMWGLGLLFPLGLFGWLSLIFAPLNSAAVVFLPPVVTCAYGWTHRHSPHPRRATPKG